MKLRSIKTIRGRLDFAELGVIRQRFGRYVRPHWKAMLAALLANMGTVAMKIASPWPIKLVFDVVLSKAMARTRLGAWFAEHAPAAIGALAVICGMILAIAVLEAACCYVRDILLARTGQSVIAKLRQSLFRHLQRLSPDVFESKRTGDLLMRLTGDMQMLRQLIVDAWISAGENVLTMIAMVAMMFWLNPLLAAIAVATIPLIAWSTVRVSRRLREVAKEQREKEGFIASIAQEVLGALTVIQAFNREHIEAERFARQNRSSLRAGMRATRLEARLFRTVSLASAAGLCAVLFFGVRAVLAEAMTAGDLLVFVAYLRAVQRPLRKLSKLVGQAAKATTCGLRISEILQIVPAVADAPDAIEARGLEGRIDIKDVSFVYPNGTRALDGLCLHIPSGRRVAVVGRSGTGKSTLLKLLLRFYDPTSGAVCIDGTDIRRFTVASLRKHIAVAEQNTVLFGITVAENIALGCAQAEQSEIEAAARAVGAHEFICQLPQSYETRLTERGSTLSGGERQRIALARAMLCGAPILVLDEPVSGLDAESAEIAEATWMTARSGRTAIVICHHYTLMERYDMIVVLADGRIVDTGTHAELLRRCEEYTALYHAWLLRSQCSVEDEADVDRTQPMAY